MSMPPFMIDMISPFPSGCTGTNGGPHMGGHNDPDPTHWFNTFGMDFSAPVGTRVYSAFTATVTKHRAHVKAKDKQFDYGAQIAARASNNLMGVFYEHISNVPAAVVPGATINQGDFLGELYIIPGSGMPQHLHWGACAPGAMRVARHQSACMAPRMEGRSQDTESAAVDRRRAAGSTSGRYRSSTWPNPHLPTRV